MRNLVLLVLVAVFSPTMSIAMSYEIEAAGNDENFIINGEKFEAKTYCLGWDVGDEVIFVEGSSSGVCTSATLFNKDRRETCEVWCE